MEHAEYIFVQIFAKEKKINNLFNLLTSNG